MKPLSIAWNVLLKLLHPGNCLLIYERTAQKQNPVHYLDNIIDLFIHLGYDVLPLDMGHSRSTLLSNRIKLRVIIFSSLEFSGKGWVEWRHWFITLGSSVQAWKKSKRLAQHHGVLSFEMQGTLTYCLGTRGKNMMYRNQVNTCVYICVYMQVCIYICV